MAVRLSASRADRPLPPRRVTRTKRATYNEQATEFHEEACALNTDAAIFDLKKRILQGYVRLGGVHEHPLV
jgi:hypothetical protein